MNLLKLVSLFVLFLSLLFVASTGVHAADLTDSQKSHIDRVLREQGLNVYGDLEGTVYLGGNPLYDETTGELKDRYDYLLGKFPHILDGFVTTLPFDGVVEALNGLHARADAKKVISNDFDSGTLDDRFMDAVVQAEEQIQTLLVQLRTALDNREYATIRDLLNQLSALPTEQLVRFGTALKDLRRMLNADYIQDLEVTEQIQKLLVQLDALEARMAA